VRLAAVFLIPCLALAVAGARADYEDGRAAEARGDRQRALQAYVGAADRDARAALALARLHEAGDGPADAEHALRWLRRAGELGDSEAQYQLGRRYLLGEGAAQREPREAVLWFERAAALGHARARFELGRLLASAPDAQRSRAQELIEQAADAGVREAQAWLGREVPSEPPEIASAEAAERDARRSRLPEYWDEDPPHVTLHWGIHQGYGNWGWSVWDPYPWYPWGAGPWSWYPYGCPGGWCSPYYGHRHGGVHFGFSIGR